MALQSPSKDDPSAELFQPFYTVPAVSTLLSYSCLPAITSVLFTALLLLRLQLSFSGHFSFYHYNYCPFPGKSTTLVPDIGADNSLPQVHYPGPTMTSNSPVDKVQAAFPGCPLAKRSRCSSGRLHELLSSKHRPNPELAAGRPSGRRLACGRTDKNVDPANYCELSVRVMTAKRTMKETKAR